MVPLVQRSAGLVDVALHNLPLGESPDMHKLAFGDHAAGFRDASYVNKHDNPVVALYHRMDIKAFKLNLGQVAEVGRDGIMAFVNTVKRRPGVTVAIYDGIVGQGVEEGRQIAGGEGLVSGLDERQRRTAGSMFDLPVRWLASGVASHGPIYRGERAMTMWVS